MTVEPDSGKIRVLPGDVVSRIAAGEVVERPSAVVKELIDNSLDAGSTMVTIDAKDGGLSLVRVVDDGAGMARPDAMLAFQRHATSKLASDRDLFHIHTMGFRGEALPSIASVSRVKMVTVYGDAQVGTEVRVGGGAIQEVRDAAAPRGTQVEVTDLFYNTPARKKFLKSVPAEFSRISQVVQQAALARPSIHFRLRHNGHDALQFPAVASHRDRVQQVYLARFVEQCVEVRSEQAGLKVEGYTINPVHARTGRTPQELFVNLRAVRNAAVAHAIQDGYGGYLGRGCHPLFVLFLQVDPGRVDVNVHPTKREIRFLDQESIHREVRRAVRHTLGVRPAEPGLDYWAGVASSWTEPGGRALDHRRSATGGENAGSEISGVLPQGSVEEQRGLYLASDEIGVGRAERAKDPNAPSRFDAFQTVSALGQVDRTYLVAQVGPELQVVDQHTAHERVLFQRLERAWARQVIPSQPLLIPEPVDLPPHQIVVLHSFLSVLEPLGLAIEPFGPSSVLIRSVPAVLGRVDYAALLKDLVEDLAEGNTPSSLEERIRPILATLACHGAVRAGREMELPEIKQLIEDWVSEGLPMTCPHGRRVALRLSTDELAKMFGRG